MKKIIEDVEKIIGKGALGAVSYISGIEFDPLPKVLYHYCDVDTFYKIIGSRNLWLTNYRFMNDPLEIQWAKKLVLNIVQELKAESNQKYFDTVANQLTLQMQIQQPYMHCSSIYADRLPLWLAYGGSGHGVVIGVRTSSLRLSHDLPHCNINPTIGTSIHQVIYNSKQQQEILRKTINFFYDQYHDYPHACAELVRRLTTMFKSSHYDWEAEWRIVNIPSLTILKNGQIDELGNHSPIRFHIAGGALRTHYELALCDNSIEDVIVGPKSALALDIVRMFLHVNSYCDFDVRRSQIAFR